MAEDRPENQGNADTAVDRGSRVVPQTQLMQMLRDHAQSSATGDLDLSKTNLRRIGLFLLLRDAGLKATPDRRFRVAAIDFSGAELQDADLSYVVFDRCNFQGAHLERAHIRGQAEFHNARFENIHLDHAELWKVTIMTKDNQGNTADTFFAYAQLEHSSWTGANLNRCVFVSSNLKNSYWSDAKLTRCAFVGSNMIEAALSRVSAESARFDAVDLSNARMDGANLTKASFKDTNLENVTLEGARIDGVVFEPQPKKLLYLPSLASVQGLSALRYEHSPTGLTELRTALREAGMREQERQIGYALLHTRFEKARSEGHWFEYWFNHILFDVPCKYGLEPGRPLWILLASTVFFTLPYLTGIVFSRHWKRSGLWVVRNENPVHKRSRTRPVEVRMRDLTADTLFGRIGQSVVEFICATGTAFYFSILSAFSIGFREINVGSWLSRLQPREHTIRATGWMRGVSGAQSLLSVYLLALWLLTYFGRPFE